jgi:hypothetical protein
MSELEDKTMARAIKLIMPKSNIVKTSAKARSANSPLFLPASELGSLISFHLPFMPHLNLACSSCEG